jgi:hypothetical protein
MTTRAATAHGITFQTKPILGTNGRAVTFEGIDVIEGDADGRIRHLRAYWDMAAMVAQLEGTAAIPPAAQGDGVTP